MQAEGKDRQLVDYAFALVLIEQQKLDEATTQLDKLLKVSPSALPYQRSRLWLQLVRKNYPAALVNMEALSRRLAPAGNAKSTTDDREAARFLGSAIAFLEGPAASPRTSKLVVQSKEKIRKTLSEPLREEFDAGSETTSEQFAKLSADITSAKDELTKLQTEAIKTQGEHLESEQTDIDDAKQALQATADKQQEKAQADAEALWAQHEELLGTLSNLQAGAIAQETRIATADAEIQSLTQTVQRDNGTTETVYTDPARVAALQGLIVRLDAQLRTLQSQVANVNARAVQVQNQYNRLVQRFNLQMQRLAGEGKQLASDQKKLDRMQKNLARAKPSGSSPKTRTLSSRLSNFTTYEPFPMAQEKARVLAAVASDE
jgi:DNA repair exonuclease SbcCD ATPase subunit